MREKRGKQICSTIEYQFLFLAVAPIAIFTRFSLLLLLGRDENLAVVWRMFILMISIATDRVCMMMQCRKTCSVYFVHVYKWLECVTSCQNCDCDWQLFEVWHHLTQRFQNIPSPKHNTQNTTHTHTHTHTQPLQNNKPRAVLMGA